MDSIKWKCKNWSVYFKKFDNFHLIHLIVEKLDVSNFHPIFYYCYHKFHTHLRELNAFFKKIYIKSGKQFLRTPFGWLLPNFDKLPDKFQIFIDWYFWINCANRLFQMQNPFSAYPGDSVCLTLTRGHT